MTTTPRKGSFMNVEIAQRLAEMRRAKGFSQEELAEQLGLSRQAVSKWERAESSPDTGNLIALADLYGVTLDELVRVDADIADDVTFEAREAALAASAAAASAAAAATAAQSAASQKPPVSQPVSQPVPPSAPHPGPQPASQPAYGAPESQPTYGVPGHPFPPHTQAPQPAPVSEEVPDQPRRRGPWTSFPYPIVCVIVFMLVGFSFGAWHPAWVVFLTIPLYYWVAHIIETDPNYRAGRR